MRILAIETSCDETAVAIVDFPERSRRDFSGSKHRPKIHVLSNIVSSQVKLHAKYGGVVPNLAKREHQKNLVPILLQALKESKLPLKIPKIDAIAVTVGPGLEPALWVGINFAKALSLLWGKPLIPTDHMKGHLYSAMMHGSKFMIHNSIHFPLLALLVSGGHTELVLMNKSGKFKIIGETLDDAAGEAFDKVARILGLGYPGGPAIAAEAARAQNAKLKAKNHNLKLKIKLPRPMLKSTDFNFSFSGLKTAVLYMVRDLTKKYSLKTLKPLIAKEFQDAVVEVLVTKTIKAAKKYKAKTILLGGGVAANKLLRETLKDMVMEKLRGTLYYPAQLTLTGDNALMIALAAYFSYKKKAPKSAVRQIGANGNLRLS